MNTSRKRDFELNIMLVIAILIIVIFIISMLIVIIKSHNNKELANTITQESNNNEINSYTNDDQLQKNEDTTNINESNAINNIDTQSAENLNMNSDIQANNNSNTNTNVTSNSNVKKYVNDQTRPFRLNGAKILEGDLSTSITIQDSNGNQWVWIEVPKSITQNANSDEEIEKALERYASIDNTSNELIASRNGGADINYEGTGMTNEQYKDKKSKMLQSIKRYGGFYIGKYETGYEINLGGKARSGSQTDVEYKTDEKPVIKANAYPYNWVNCKQAEALAESLATDGKNTSLLFGIQWDLVIKYLNTKGMNTYYLTQDSSVLGNYANNGKKQLLKTGNKKYSAPMGIYDLAGNVWEWTLERASLSSIPSTVRGGDYNSNGNATPVSYRGSVKLNLCSDSVGFRCALY